MNEKDKNSKSQEELSNACNPQEGFARDNGALYWLKMSHLERKVLISLAVSGEPERLQDLAHSTGLDKAELDGILTSLHLKGIITLVNTESQELSQDLDEVIGEAEIDQIQGGHETYEPAQPEQEYSVTVEEPRAIIQEEAQDAQEIAEAIWVEAPEFVSDEEEPPISAAHGLILEEEVIEEEVEEEFVQQGIIPAEIDETRPPPDVKIELVVKIEFDSLTKYLDILKGMHYYEVLGLDPEAGRKEIRGKYYDLVSKYHPDRHNQIDDPKVKELLADIFALLTLAYETLYSKKERIKYDRTIPEVTGAYETEEDQALEALFGDSGVEETETDEDEEKPSGWSFYQTALEDFQVGNYQAAEMSFKLALGMEPGRREYQEGLERTRKILSKQLIEEFTREGERLEEQRQFQSALAAFIRASELDPDNADLRYALARIRFLKTMDRKRAAQDVARTLALNPKHVDALLLRGRIEAFNGDREAAIQTFKEILAIMPGNEKARQALELFDK